jgi:hypothetical protein
LKSNELESERQHDNQLAKDRNAILGANTDTPPSSQKELTRNVIIVSAGPNIEPEIKQETNYEEKLPLTSEDKKIEEMKKEVKKEGPKKKEANKIVEKKEEIKKESKTEMKKGVDSLLKNENSSSKIFPKGSAPGDNNSASGYRKAMSRIPQEIPRWKVF